MFLDSGNCKAFLKIAIFMLGLVLVGPIAALDLDPDFGSLKKK